MNNIGKSSASLNDDVQVAEPPERKKWPWHIIGPIVGTLLKIGWEIVRDLVIKK